MPYDQSMMSLISRVFGFVARRIIKVILPYFYSTPFIYGQHKVTIGSNSNLANTYVNARSGTVSIGNDVIFGNNVCILTGLHDYSKLDSYRATVETAERDIVIEDNVWIATGAIVIGKVTIGKNAVVAAGSVVTKDVPAGVMVAGVPAKIIKELS